MNEDLKTLTAEIRLLREEVAALSSLRKEVAELTALVSEMVSPSETLAIAEKSRIIREAHASGDPRKIRMANKRTNRGKKS